MEITCSFCTIILNEISEVSYQQSIPLVFLKRYCHDIFQGKLILRDEERATAAEKEAEMANERAATAEREATASDIRAIEAEERAIAAEERAIAAEMEAEIARKIAREAEETATSAEKEAKMAKERVREAEGMPSWTIQREEIDLTDQVLGSGGWCVVKAAKFRGLDVAAKLLHRTIISPYNIELFKREMNMAAMVHHPNLLLFIGATVDRECIILTELMPTSLRTVIENGRLLSLQVVPVAKDICRALNYLHSMKPVPIVHRDVSSANVLLEPHAAGNWRAKLSDYGSANFLRQLSTVAPGSSVYAAPESLNPSQQSPKMDTFSFGVLVLEMMSRQFPDAQRREPLLQSLTSRAPDMVRLISECTINDFNTRPTMMSVMYKLSSCTY